MVGRSWWCAALTMLILVAGTGCKTQSSYEVRVQLAEPLAQNAQDVEVDLVAVSRANFDYWYNMNVSDYWQGPTSMRQQMIQSGATKTLKFSSVPGTQAIVTRDDPVWDQWTDQQKAYAIIVLSNTPRGGPSAAGLGDMRRRILYVRRSVKRPVHVSLRVTPAGLMDAGQ